ncbi:MAG: isoprenylcysteine carboxylmethyltransferase family protein [Anaerolineales bacterium]|nr:isoprenylcysteine carboxylmethyltransferase family protein [Anaerolineales bacterium]
MQTGVFVLLTILLLAFTLSRPQRHRFYRFFAFESVLGLVLLNSDAWFLDPFSVLQLISWTLLIGSLLLALHGFRLLRTTGSPDGDIEDTTRLVTTGAYRHIRHPLYCSLLILGVGAFLKDPSVLGFSLLVILLLFLYATAKVEERDNLQKFGSAYREYMKKTKMFIPYLL